MPTCVTHLSNVRKHIITELTAFVGIFFHPKLLRRPISDDLGFCFSNYYRKTIIVIRPYGPVGMQALVHFDFHIIERLERREVRPIRICNLNTSDSGLHHTISLMYVGAHHLGFGIT